MDTEKIKSFAKLIDECDNLVFFGGAGVSTESGVKDYRSEDGLYKTVHEYGVNPETILSHTFYMNHTDVFYDFYGKYFLLDDIKPNRAHTALAELENLGKIKAVITQNIDGLHQAAGSKNVLELHGTIKKYRCMKCGFEEGYDYVKAHALEIPYCKKCGGILKPEVVLYEEPLNDETQFKAIDAIAAADMLIIGGTSLAVYPAASFLQFFRGKYIILINKGETSFDSRADLVFRDSIGEVLSMTLEEYKNLKKA